MQTLVGGIIMLIIFPLNWIEPIMLSFWKWENMLVLNIKKVHFFCYFWLLHILFSIHKTNGGVGARGWLGRSPSFPKNWLVPPMFSLLFCSKPVDITIFMQSLVILLNPPSHTHTLSPNEILSSVHDCKHVTGI